MEAIKALLLDLLNEIYVGPHDKPTWVIDQKGHGFTETIKTIDAEQASKPVVKGGSTIAAHTEHLRWSIRVALEFFEGKMPKPNWAESWRTHEVNDAEWKTLQKGLQEAYTDLKTAIEKHTDWSNPLFNQGVLALLPHAAYHLSAVKQLAIATHK